MRRLTGFALAFVLCVLVGGAVVLLTLRLSGSTGSGYLVRAVFENSSFVIPGEQVEVAGVTVGTIRSIELTPQNRAALVLAITDRRFVPFRAGAHCEIDLESLLGEQYVQCTPTDLHPAGRQLAPIPAIHSGPNAGQHLLGVADTTSPVGFDLLQDITRMPQQEFLRELLDGLGAGLDANGPSLNAALQTADPALQKTDQVIAVLAREDRTIAALTDESARVLAPLAAEHGHISGLFDHAGAVAAAAATQGPSIEASLASFPPFLRQLVPAAGRLTALADQFTPAVGALEAEAPAVNATTENLGPLALAAIPALRTLGTVADRGTSVLPQAGRVAAQLRALSGPLQPAALDLAALLESFDRSGGIEDLMRFIYYYTGSVNGENSLGHYLRALVQLGATQRTSVAQGPGVSATFSCSLAESTCSALDGGAARADAAEVAAADRVVAGVARSAAHGAARNAGMQSLVNYLLRP